MTNFTEKRVEKVSHLWEVQYLKKLSLELLGLKNDFYGLISI